MKRYQVETYTLCDGWINASTDEHGEPVLFDTLQEAQEDLDVFWQDLTADGMAEEYCREEWRISEVTA